MESNYVETIQPMLPILAFTLVMFKLPALMPPLVMDGPLLITKPPSVILVSPIVKEPDGVKLTSLDN